MNARPAAGDVIAHYRIVRRLGAGGMGEVFLATDSRLGRQVTIKFLAPQAAPDAELLRRFEQEARAASALNHPNIVTIFDVGDFEGAPYIVAEFVDGETLRERISRGRMDLIEIIAVATQVTRALAVAHESGIIHRDIKPENIMIRRDGNTKVLDFGLAKLVAVPERFTSGSATQQHVGTLGGTVLGTVSYMSPEQARGVAVDPSTDVFSLGIVMYEMLAGQRPFRGETSTDVIADLLRSDPPALSTLRDDIPLELERIVRKSLSKERAGRYPSSRELALALDELGDQRSGSRAYAGAFRPRLLPRLAIGVAAVATIAVGVALFRHASRDSPPAAIRAIAVLPFAHVGGNGDAAVMADGITEHLIDRLSQLPGLKVMSRNAIARYAIRNGESVPDAKKAARELHVDAVLSGTVRQDGPTLAVSVDLIDARDDTEIWGERYDDARAGILDLQSEIAAHVAAALHVKVSAEQERRLQKRDTKDSEAYGRYIRGEFYLDKRSADAIRKGREFFQQAIEIDPAYALAYAGISDSYALLAAQAALSPRDAYPAALAAARKAVELDPSLGEGHASLAHAAFHLGDLATADREFARALALKPNDVSALHWQSEYLQDIGRHDAAIASTKRALAIDPLDLASNAQLAGLEIAGGQNEAAIAQLRKTLEIDPNYFLAHLTLGNAYLRMRRFDEAAAEFETAARLTGGWRGPAGAALAYAMSGRPAEARRIATAMETASATTYVSPLDIARIHAVLHDRPETLHWLALARQEAGRPLRRLPEDADFAFLRSDPAFDALTQQ